MDVMQRASPVLEARLLSDCSSSPRHCHAQSSTELAKEEDA